MRMSNFSRLDFTRTRISRRRPLSSYSKVQALVSAIVRNRAGLQRVDPKPLLNVGCGPDVHPAFLNLDWTWRPGVLCWDVTKRLPFTDGAFDGIYTEHCFEHLPFEAMPSVLREMRRVLRHGGTLRIVVPDGEIYARNYIERKPMPYGEHEITPMFSMNRIMRAHGHRFIYDFETFARLLADAGFTATRAAYRQGRDSRLLIDQEWHAFESLYIDAH